MEKSTKFSIDSEAEYDKLLKWIDTQFDKNLNPNTTEGKLLQASLLLIKNYENKYYPVPLA